MSEQAESKPQRFRFKHLPGLIKDTAKAWIKDDPWRLSAIVAYYAILSLPGLLVIVISTVGYFWGAEIIEGRVYEEIRSTMGVSTADAVESIFRNAREDDTSLVSAIIGIGALLFGATGVFFHLQISINRIWEVKSDPKSEFLRFLIDRTKSFGFVLVVGFLLLVSFVLSATFSALREYFARWIPDIAYFLLRLSDRVLSFGVITVLFALIYKYLPDVKIGWKSVWIGAVITSFLFSIGREILSYYFGAASPGSVYGAAGSVVIILLWVTYSCLILFFGAEFTWVLTKKYGYEMRPARHAKSINKWHVEDWEAQKPEPSVKAGKKR